MDCRDFQNNLFAYMEGELTHEFRDAMAEHTMLCGSCSRLLAGFLAIERAIELDKAQEPNPFFATRILQQLANDKKKHGLFTFPVLRPVMLTLALLAALMTGFFIGNHGMSRKSQVSFENNQIEVLKSDFHVHDFVDEDITLLTNY